MRFRRASSGAAVFSVMKIRILLFLASLMLATLLAVPAAMAQETPFDSQYAPPTGPPPTTECVENGSGSDASNGADGCIEVLPATGGSSSIPFAAIAPAALLGAGIIVTAGIVVARRRS